MELEKIAQLLIYTHAAFGGLALLSGLVALISQKGKAIHKKSGKLFFYTMLLSAITALIISCIPNHHNPFLFTIGIFSSYFILTGYRAIRFKKKNPDLKIDKLIAIIMLITGIIMILFPIVLNGALNIILTVFGLLGIIAALRDLRLFKDPNKLKQNWLKLHLGNMIGGYIAATTAFIVVNNLIPGVFGWFVPGLIGGIYIAYWNKKLSK